MKIFIVEDDPWYSEMVAYHLSLNPDYEVSCFRTARECIEALYMRPDVVSLDYDLSGENGGRLLKRIKQQYADIAVVMLSGQEDVQTAVELLHGGADDYIVKNEQAIPRLRHALQKIERQRQLQQEVETLREQVSARYDFSRIVKGTSSAMQDLFRLLSKAAGSSITVSITGETGTGKELVARAVHYNSERHKEAFVAVNVAAIPSELIESELFGYEKGAFTGAAERRIGKIEQAHKGTLFLDEVAEMPLEMQSKLLRVLQERELVRLGGSQLVRVDFRLIIATHRQLIEEVRNKRFREDLYYRLLGLSVTLPALRDRKEDIPLLAEHFLQEYALANNRPMCYLSVEAQKRLLSYAFPGNIRELRALIELAVVMAEGEEIVPEHLLFPEQDLLSVLLREEPMTLRGYVRSIVRHYMDKYGNDYDLVAEKLDMGKSTLYKMRKEGEI